MKVFYECYLFVEGIAGCTIMDVIEILIFVLVLHVVPQEISHFVMSEGFITVEYH